MQSLDPANPHDVLQGAIVKALQGDDAFVATGAGVVDKPAPNQKFPYVVLGEGQTLPDPAIGYDGSDCFIVLHVWSRAVGFPRAKAIAGAVRRVLHYGELDLAPSFRLVEMTLEDEHYLRDPDGLSQHVPMTFKAQIEPA